MNILLKLLNVAGVNINPATDAGTRTRSPAIAPDEIQSATLRAWYKADALALADNAAVNSFTDSSGNSRHAIPGGASATAPTYKTGIINGLPAIRFNGTNNGLFIPDGTLTGNRWVFMVGVVRAQLSRMMFSVARGAGAPGSFDISDVGGSNGWDETPSAISYGSFGALVVGRPFSINGHWSRLGGKLFSDGALGASNALAAETSDSTIGMGFRALGVTQGDNWAQVDIAECIVVSGPLSEYERQGIERYLAKKYAMRYAGLDGLATEAAAVGIGAPADAAATTDAGTFSLIALFKRMLAGLKVQGMEAGRVPVNLFASNTGLEDGRSQITPVVGLPEAGNIAATIYVRPHIFNSATGLWDRMRKGQQSSANSLAATLSTEQEAILAARASEATQVLRNNAFATLIHYLPRAAADEMRADETATDRYHGRATDGTLTSAASWEVVRFYKDASDTVIRTRYRTGVAWDNRATGWT